MLPSVVTLSDAKLKEVWENSKVMCKLKLLNYPSCLHQAM